MDNFINLDSSMNSHKDTRIDLTKEDIYQKRKDTIKLSNEDMIQEDTQYKSKMNNVHEESIDE